MQAALSESASSNRQAVATLAHVGKQFGTLQALADVGLELYAGEVHALLGENGAGKTTLMRILAGIMRPDVGTLSLHGEVVRLNGRRDGAARRIGMVQQHFGLVEALNGVENFVLGRPRAGLLARTRAAREQLRATLHQYDLHVDIDKPVAHLTMPERQRLEVLCALASGSDLLILDEPTAALPSADIARLKRVIAQLKQQGAAIVYISHKLGEVIELADRVTVLRRGRVVARFEGRVDSASQLADAMVGELGGRAPGERVGPIAVTEASDTPGAARAPAAQRHDTPVVRWQKVSVAANASRGGLRAIDFEVRGGEIVGVAGVEGSGQEALAETLCGLASLESGSYARRPRIAAYIPQDRAREGLAMAMSITENAIVHRHRERSIASPWAISWVAAQRFARALVDRFEVRVGDCRDAAASLSGGNQQKLVVARELERDPDLVVAHNPYRGLDIHAAAQVRRQLSLAAERGAGVVLLSPDLDDLFDLCARIVVLFDGALVGEIDPRAANARDIGALLGGHMRERTDDQPA